MQRMTSRVWRAILFACGTLCVGLGILGMFLPLMPTTVFLLMAAACYARSSERFHRKLVENRWLGPYIKRRGLAPRQKAIIVTVLWAGLIASMVWSIDALWLRLLLVGIGLAVTLHVVRLPGLEFRHLDGADHQTSA
jgi:uncharacterized protein